MHPIRLSAANEVPNQPLSVRFLTAFPTPRQDLNRDETRRASW